MKKLLNIPINSSKFLLRILLSPFVLLYGIFMLCALTVFPLPLIVMFSFWGLIMYPFIYLLNKSGANLEYAEPFIDNKYYIIGYLLGATIYIWGAPTVMINYILTGEVFAID